MVSSLESSRPIMAPSLASQRASKRFSTYSGTPSEAASVSTVSTHGDPRLQDINELSKGLERLNSTRLQQQRYIPSAEQQEHLSKLALGAKVERALGRRMTSQDAVLRTKPREIDEKQVTERPSAATRRTVA